MLRAWRFIRLRTRLVLMSALLMLAGLVAGLGITYESLVHLRLMGLDEENRLLALVLMEEVLREPRLALTDAAESYLLRSAGISTAQIYLGSEPLWVGGVLDAPATLDPLGLKEGGERTVGVWRVHTLQREGVTVQVGRSLVTMRAVLQPFARIALVLVLTLPLLTGLLAWWVVGAALQPVELLTRAVQDFDENTDAALPLLPGSGEGTVLASSFAALLARLRHERQREQRFLAYAAHELRTPISALRASLEAARLRDEPPERAWFVRQHREALRLEVLAQNLLALSRAEAGELRVEALDLAEVAATAYDRFQPLALERGYELVLEAQPAPFEADPRLLEQALNNLVMNALRHTPPGVVTIRSGCEGTLAFLEVADLGSGGVERAREGLGLRVAQAVARAHGGSLACVHDVQHRVRLLLVPQEPLRIRMARLD